MLILSFQGRIPVANTFQANRIVQNFIQQGVQIKFAGVIDTDAPAGTAPQLLLTDRENVIDATETPARIES